MEKSFEIHDRIVTLTAIRYIYRNETTAQDGILVHDETDTYRNGDAIYSGNLEYIATASDAKALLEEHGETAFTVDDTGTYHVL